MTHELANSKEMTSYFANKFYPAKPVYVLGQTYKSWTDRSWMEALFDNWMDRSHAMSPHCHPCITPSCVWIFHHVCECALASLLLCSCKRSCDSMFSLRVPSLCGRHCCMRCVAMPGVECHCSSLPSCSEIMFQQVTLIHPSFRDHSSHAVCASISTCMCVAIQLFNLLAAGRAMRGVSSHCSCLPPCSEIMLAVRSYIACSLWLHFSVHVRRASVVHSL